MMKNSVYITGAFLFGIASLAFYSMTSFHYAGDDVQILSNGATGTDIVYYNSIKIASALCAISLSCISIFLNSVHPENLAIYFSKYLLYAISSILFVRVIFHFREYDEIPLIEDVIRWIIVVVCALRALQNKGKLKSIEHLCHSLYHKHHRSS